MNRCVPDRRDRRAGFTMAELMIGLVVAGVSATATMAVFKVQNRATEALSNEVDAQQNARAALDLLVREIRLIGTNVDRFNQQSIIIEAAPFQLAFNGDVHTGIGGSVAMDRSKAMNLTGTATYKPGSYLTESLGDLTRFNNGAETVRLGLDLNNDGDVNTYDRYKSTQDKGDFLLTRQVNDEPLETVASGLRGPIPDAKGLRSQPLFQYWGAFNGKERALWGDTNSDGVLSDTEIVNLKPVPTANLGDILEVTITVTTGGDDRKTNAANDLESSGTMLRTTIRPRNIGINPSDLHACGEVPQPPQSLTAIDTPEDAGRSIRLTFSPSFDEVQGEQDVQMYYIYRRKVGETRFGSPIQEVKATGAAKYVVENNTSNVRLPDDAPLDGVPYEYAVSSWDCEPQESRLSAIAGPVISIPNGPLPPTITGVFDTPCDEGGKITVQFAASPDDGTEMFEGYRVFRGTTAQLTAYKIRVAEIPAGGVPTYNVDDGGTGLIALSPDSSYYYVARGVRNGIESVDSNQWGPVRVSFGVSAPELVEVKDVAGDLGTKLALTWIASASEKCGPGLDLASYRVERKSLYESTFRHIHTVSLFTGGPYAWTDSTVLANVLYQYRVVADGNDGTSALSLVQAGQATAENQLQPPVGVIAASVPCDVNGAIQIDWDRSPSESLGLVTTYHVYRSLALLGPFDLRIATVSVGAGQSHYTVVDGGGLLNTLTQPVLGNLYYYVVRSVNSHANAESQNSTTANARSQTTPSAPEVTQATDTPSDQGRSITVNFNRSSHDGDCASIVTSYRVYRGTNAGNVNTQVGTLTASRKTSYAFVDDLINSSSAPQDNIEYFYAVRAYASELISQLSNVAGPAVSQPNAAAVRTLFSDDFETDRGWVSNDFYGWNDWERATPSANWTRYGNSDPSAAVSGSKVIGNSLGSSYDSKTTYNDDADVYIDSPQINCSTARDVKLTFKRWLNVDSPSSDRARIYVRTASLTWQKVWENPARITDSSWQTIELDISDIADGQTGVQIRFRMTSNSSYAYTGWNIDDVKVVGY